MPLEGAGESVQGPWTIGQVLGSAEVPGFTSGLLAGLHPVAWARLSLNGV